MTTEEIRSIITNKFSSSWATATPICWPNQHFKEPNDIWIRPVIKFADTVYGEIGEEGVGLRNGLLMISIYDLANNGTKQGLSYANRLENLFRRQDLSGVMFKEASTDITGLDDNGYYGFLTTISFETWIGEDL